MGIHPTWGLVGGDELKGQLGLQNCKHPRWSLEVGLWETCLSGDRFPGASHTL